MRNRVFQAMCKVPMNLQLFAEGETVLGPVRAMAADLAKVQAVRVEIILHLLMTS